MELATLQRCLPPTLQPCNLHPPTLQPCNLAGFKACNLATLYCDSFGPALAAGTPAAGAPSAAAIASTQQRCQQVQGASRVCAACASCCPKKFRISSMAHSLPCNTSPRRRHCDTAAADYSIVFKAHSSQLPAPSSQAQAPSSPATLKIQLSPAFPTWSH